MDVVKIGKFIAQNRKKKNMTQENLAEKLGVTSKTISRWENGNYMPDISLLKPLSDELDITLNDLLSGEEVDKEKYQEKLEENILNTIDYSNKRINQKDNLIGVILIIVGLICSITAMSIFPSESSWGSVYSVIGAIISLIGVAKFTKKFNFGKRLALNFGYFIVFVALLIFIDFLGVINIHQAPRFATIVTSMENCIYYDTPFYDVIRYNPGTNEEKIILINNQKCCDETIDKYVN